MSDELKPCPFCGNNPRIICDPEQERVKCNRCDCEVASTQLCNWNTRPIEDDLRRQLAKANAELDKLIDNRNVGMCTRDSSLAFRIAELVSVVNDERAELARLREAQRWIPVGERLPEEFRDNMSRDVLVWCVDGLAFARYDRYEYFINSWIHYSQKVGWTQIDGVTHWRPMPEPPEVTL